MCLCSRQLGIARALGAQRGRLYREVRSGLFERVLPHRIAGDDAREGSKPPRRASSSLPARTVLCAPKQLLAHPPTFRLSLASPPPSRGGITRSRSPHS